MTAIVVYGTEVLEPYASGLTTPEILWNAPPLASAVTLQFRYVTGARPRLDWSALDH